MLSGIMQCVCAESFVSLGLRSQSYFSSTGDNFKHIRCLVRGFYNLGDFQKKMLSLLLLTGLDTEPEELLLLLRSQYKPLTTHHERLSSNVREMLSDLCRFLCLSSLGSSNAFSSAWQNVL